MHGRPSVGFLYLGKRLCSQMFIQCSRYSDDTLYFLWQVKHYSGAVLCGNLFLESDIGGGKNIAPAIVYPNAIPDKYYTVVMIDPVGSLFAVKVWCADVFILITRRIKIPMNPSPPVTLITDN